MDESSGSYETLDWYGGFYVLSEESRDYDGDAEGDERWSSEEDSV